MSLTDLEYQIQYESYIRCARFAAQLVAEYCRGTNAMGVAEMDNQGRWSIGVRVKREYPNADPSQVIVSHTILLAKEGLRYAFTPFAFRIANEVIGQLEKADRQHGIEWTALP